MNLALIIKATNTYGNGIKPTGKQNFRCNELSKIFQKFYQNRGADPATRSQIERTLCQNCGICDIEKIFFVSRYYVLYSKPYRCNLFKRLHLFDNQIITLN